ncbi:HTH domain-containing protein [Halomonas sp. YLGW01]|uniref:HTH domain-containing protein n=1 Tax=Halomonas sp. YLGW01 TaxID=2773308 RepID=UPI00177EF77D|nr:HTH domain-containing protein [Halomonas sp. YLGW01]
MSRKTRLQDLVRVLRGHEGPVSGTTLAETLGISLRTLYQDVAVLKAVGAEIEHLPNSGYALAPGVLLPALMLSEEELDALALGLDRVEAAAGPLAEPAAQLRSKMAKALPDDQARRLTGLGLTGPGGFAPDSSTLDTATFDNAALDTARPDGQAVDRAGAAPAIGQQAASSDELVFYTNPLSRGGIVHWLLEELGVPYRMEMLEYGTTMKSPEFLAINPMGKVPAIRHGEVVVTETAAICAYLADAFPEAGLAPSAPLRGDYYRWLFFAAGPMETAASLEGLLGVHPDARQQMQLGCGSLAAVLDTLAGALANKRYIAGDAFSAADIYVSSHLGWGMQFGTIPWRPEFEAYWAGLRDRPARLRCEAFVAEAMALTA